MYIGPRQPCLPEMRVNLSAIRNAALRERHRAPRERAVRLEADVRRAEVVVDAFAVEATA
jgi:hypothetical protein